MAVPDSPGCRRWRPSVIPLCPEPHLRGLAGHPERVANLLPRGSSRPRLIGHPLDPLVRLLPSFGGSSSSAKGELASLIPIGELAYGVFSPIGPACTADSGLNFHPHVHASRVLAVPTTVKGA